MTQFSAPAAINFEQPAAAKPIPNFAKILFSEEAEGILAWAVEGARLLLKDLAEVGKIRMSETQRKRVADLLAASDIRTRPDERSGGYTACL